MYNLSFILWRLSRWLVWISFMLSLGLLIAKDMGLMLNFTGSGERIHHWVNTFLLIIIWSNQKEGE